jgi:CRISPR-associated protein Csm1
MYLLERERILLRTLLQDLGTIFQHTGLPGSCEILLPEPFRDAVNFADEASNAPTALPERLAPVAEKVCLERPKNSNPDHTYRYPLKPLSIQSQEMMPQQAENIGGYVREDYRQIWQAFTEEMQQLQGQEHFEAYFFTIYFLLKKYFSRVPSAKAIDISFFDHARITAAIELCRYLYHQEQENHNRKTLDPAKEFLLIEGGVSGIQRFIFNMISPQQERARLAKRLRGRSFYLLLLAETVADYLLKSLELNIVNQLWCTGGHFFLIAPNIPRVTYRLKACYQAINEFLIQKLRGEISCVLSWIPASGEDLENTFDDVRRQLSENSAREKGRKLHNVLHDNKNLQFPSQPSKQATEYLASGDRYVEELHAKQEEIGIGLTRLNKGYNRLVKIYDNVSKPQKRNVLTTFQIGNTYHVTWVANPDSFEGADTVYLLNDTDHFWGSGSMKYGFKFLATHVDTYETQVEVDEYNRNHPGELPVKLGDTKHFTDIAEAGNGGFLGVLRMDVDRLGTIFGFGIEKSNLFRIASLSSEIDLFFTGYVQHLCQTTFRKNMYIAYSGGDDLFIVGAWDQVVKLACRLRKDFKTFTCQNPEINISGGVLLCKGKHPINRAAEQAKHLLDDLAKENDHDETNLKGKVNLCDALAMFNHRMPWDEFLDLKHLGEQLIEAIVEGRLNRTFLYKLLDLHKTWSAYKQLNTARMYYVTVRSIQDTALRKLLLSKLSKHQYLSNQSYIPMLVGYTALKTKTRGEGEKHA